MVQIRSIDISSWTSNKNNSDASLRRQCASQMASGMEELGMVAITGHGIGRELSDLMAQSSQQWFEQPLSTKLQYTRGPYGCSEGGYTAQGIEAVAASEDGQSAKDHVDPIESFVYRGEPGDGASTGMEPFVAISREYYQQLCRLLHVLHQILCCALEMSDIDYFWNNQIVSDEGHSLKFSYYPDDDACAGNCKSKLRYGAHTDFQDITILKPDDDDWRQLSLDVSSDSPGAVLTTGGLQVWDRRAEMWEPVILLQPDALCVNLGDFWNIWSHGRFLSPVHRVTGFWELERDKAKPLLERRKQARTSTIFFSVPRSDALIQPLPGTSTTVAMAKENGNGSPFLDQGQGELLTAGEHLALKLARINNEQATR